MCVSLLIETDVYKASAVLGVDVPTIVANGPLGRRLEAHAQGQIIHIGAGGKLALKPMSFNPYLIRRQDISGDMWVSSLVGANHGLLLLRGFSDWVAPEPLVRLGLVDHHDVNCAFNRTCGPLLLANFVPERALLVPVLFDLMPVAKDQEPFQNWQFIMISESAPNYLKTLGVAHVPLSLDLESAFQWINVAGSERNETDAQEPRATSEPVAEKSDHFGPLPVPAQEVSDSMDTSFLDVLAEARPETYAFSLYKSA